MAQSASETPESYRGFLENRHSPLAEKLLGYLNRSLLKELKAICEFDKPIRALEIGPGKGYFVRALSTNPIVRHITVFDRSELVLHHIQKLFNESVEVLPALHQGIASGRKHELTYAAYVLGHLQNGLEVVRFLQQLKALTIQDGYVVALVPDAMRTGTEFWNIDYTHVFPTTKRNCVQCFEAAGLEVVRMSSIAGLLTLPGCGRSTAYQVLATLLRCLPIRLLHALTYPLLRVPYYSANSFWYRLYCLVQQENILIIARERKSPEVNT